MAWHAKPSGGYAIGSSEATDNMNAYYSFMGHYCSKNNVVGQLCNVRAESGFNPWRWQGDRVGTSRGYGLYQFTPAKGYLNLSGIPGHSPNMSTSSISGGNVTDAVAQMYVFVNNTLSKWVPSCWRSYWNTSTYASLYAKRTHILNTYGSGSSLSLSQFLQIDDVGDACFAFLACFEGPRVPNYSARMAYAQQISDAIGGGPVPPGPEPPEPDPFNIVLYGKKKKKVSYAVRKRRL